MLAMAVAALASAGAEPGDALRATLSRPPLAFVENRGQWKTEARFVARRGGLAVAVEPGAILLRLEGRADEDHRQGVLFRLGFEGANPGAVLEGEGKLSGVHNFFQGRDPARWVTEVPGYASVLCREIYAGVDLRVREQDGHLEYDLLLSPGAALANCVVQVEGIDGIRRGEEGALLFETPLGDVRQGLPVTWQVGRTGALEPLDCRYRILDGTRYAFEVEDREADLPLVVDPGLEWSTFLGGSGVDSISAAALDPSGLVVVAGTTTSSDFPGAPGTFESTPGSSNAFVATVAPDGSSLLSSTTLGGANHEYLHGLWLDPSGETTICGITGSPSFPVTPGAFDTTFGGPYFGYSGDAFVATLAPGGIALTYATYLGGTESEFAGKVARTAAGGLVVAGRTLSTDFPTTAGAHQTTFGGSSALIPPTGDVFLALLAPGGATLAFSTFLGAAGNEHFGDLEVAPSGDFLLAGGTISPGFPTTPGAFDTTFNSTGFDGDAFVSRFTGAGSLTASTFLGGIQDDRVEALVVDGLGSIVVVGTTYSPAFPTTPSAYDPTFNGPFPPLYHASDGFAARLDPSLATLSFSTFVGGAVSNDALYAVAVDSAGTLTVAGITKSVDFPVTPGAFDTTFNQSTGPPPPVPTCKPPDAVVCRLDAAGASLLYSTYLGAPGDDIPGAVLLDATNAATLVGRTGAPGFPTTRAVFDTTYNGNPSCCGEVCYASGSDGFVARLDLLPAGTSQLGVSTPGCSGPLAIGVSSWPQVGNAAFSATCTNAPPLALGTLGIAFAPAKPPILVAGAIVALDPLATLFLDATSDAVGASEVAIPIPSDPILAGGEAYAQFFWNSPCAPGGVSASNGLEIVVQP